MTKATAFPDPWGYDKLVGNSSTNIFQAAIDVWRNAGAQGIGLDLTFGIIPLLLLVLVYTRTKKIGNALFVMLVSAWGLKGINLVSYRISIIMSIIFVVGLGMNLAYTFINKN